MKYKLRGIHRDTGETKDILVEAESIVVAEEKVNRAGYLVEAPNDAQLYLKATQEVDGGKQNPALWAKAMALTEGNEKKAKYRYITLRVEEWSKKKHLNAVTERL